MFGKLFWISNENNKESMEKIEIAKILEWHNSGTLKTDEAVEKIFYLFSVSQQRELFDAILDFTEDLPMCSEDYNRDTLYKRYIAENCG